MSRYYLQVGKLLEEQRSSGVWIATAAGSTGGLRSAGGKVLPKEDKKFQYKPRELYYGKKTCYHLKGGIKPGPKSDLDLAHAGRGGFCGWFSCVFTFFFWDQDFCQPFG